MKRKSFSLLFLAILSLASCQSHTSSNTSGSSISGGYEMKDFLVSVNTDYSYSISFSINQDLLIGQQFYFSKDSLFDENDTLALNTGTNQYIRINYGLFDNDFYILLVDSSSTILSKENIVIPTFNMYINPGSGNDAGNNIISFAYLPNGYTPNNFFDVDGITIYRSKTLGFNNDETETVKENVTISDEYIVSDDDAYPYYQFTSSFGAGKGTFQSQIFTKGQDYGTNLFNIDSLSLDNTTGMNFKVEGHLADGTISSLELFLINKNDKQSYYEPLTIRADLTFSGSLDLTRLGQALTNYQAYLSFASGIFVPLTYSFLSSPLPEKKTYLNKIYSFYNDAGQLAIVFKNNSGVNIINAELVNEDGTVYFESTGTYNQSLFSIDPLTTKTMTVSSPIISFIADPKNGVETINYDLVLDDNNGFSVKADLSKLTKLGPWYTIKLYFNTTTITDASGNSSYINQATYEYKLIDANNYSQSLKSTTSTNLYRFQCYDVYLKLEIKDYSATVTSWNYVLVDNRMQLRLTGSFFKGASYFDIYNGSNAGNDHHKKDVVLNEDNTFTVDIDINDIVPKTIYHVHWIGDETFGDYEITNDTLSFPHSINSSSDGYIFSVKQETYQSTRYFKVYKDNDWAKATDMNFLSQDNKAFLSVSGYLNSNLTDKDSLYLQLGALVFDSAGNQSYPDGCVYTPITVTSPTLYEGYKFTAEVDLSIMTKKNYTYQLKLMKKTAEGYEDIPIINQVGYTGFCPPIMGLKL
jgi:hypothetical protein